MSLRTTVHSAWALSPFNIRNHLFGISRFSRETCGSLYILKSKVSFLMFSPGYLQYFQGAVSYWRRVLPNSRWSREVSSLRPIWLFPHKYSGVLRTIYLQRIDRWRMSWWVTSIYLEWDEKASFVIYLFQDWLKVRWISCLQRIASLL